jgi:GxxExxY protein
METQFIQFEEPEVLYQTSDLIYKDEVFEIIGICMEIHNELGKGFNEVVYKDAMEHEFRSRKIYYEREKKFKIKYKDIFLDRTYDADFVYDDKIILEVKAQQNVIQEHFKQTINYLAVSKLNLGLIINFGEDSLKFKRVVL